MKKFLTILIGIQFAAIAMLASADPADPADVILSNPGKFNAAPGICILIGAGNIGQCIKFIQENYVSPPACDGNLRSDDKVCGKNEE